MNSLAPEADPQLNEQDVLVNFEPSTQAPPELTGEMTFRGMNALATEADPQLNEQEAALNFEQGGGGGGGGGTIHAAQDFFLPSTGQTMYALSHQPIGGSEIVTINGLREPETEYIVISSQIIFNDGSGILSGDKIVISYLY